MKTPTEAATLRAQLLAEFGFEASKSATVAYLRNQMQMRKAEQEADEMRIEAIAAGVDAEGYIASGEVDDDEIQLEVKVGEETIYDAVTRTGSIKSAVRHIVVHVGEGKERYSAVLPTPITKLAKELEFRGGRGARPIEQYAFQVGEKVVERFADATALVLQLSQVKINPLAEKQIYVEQALRIVAGEAELRVVEDTTGYVPAKGALTSRKGL